MSTLSVASVLAVLAFTSVASAAPEMKPLKIAKECSQYTGEIPSFCTITDSSLAAIPSGSRIYYYGPVISSPLFSSSSAIVVVGNGDTAVGYCVVYDSASPLQGNCAFHAGSGTLAGFQAIVAVTVDDQSIYHWDGGYTLGAAQ